MSRIVALVLLVLAGVAPVLTSVPSDAAGECDRWAATGGDDGNPGTQAAPYRSLDKLVDSLVPGQTGCLPAGQTYWAVEGNGVVGGGGTLDAPVSITSGPGGARAVVKGAIWLQGTSHDIRIENLALAGGYNPDGSAYAKKSTFLVLHGDRISLVANDITNPFGICVGVGRGHQTSTDGNVLAEDVRITSNDIHGCGMDPSITWQTTDSGAHGIYLEHTLDAVVRQNLIYGNRYRGLQLWPRNDGAEIAYNTFDENATHVNIGSSIACGDVCRAVGGFVSENTDVHHNIMSNRVTDWRPGQNPSQVYGFFPADTDPAEYGNTVHDNCFAPDDETTTGHGYRTYDNIVAPVTYADRGHRDYQLAADSACIGMGPSRLQPSNEPVPPVVKLHDAAVVEGTDPQGLTELHMRVSRTGDLSRPTNAMVTWDDITATTNEDYNFLPDGGPLFEAGESETRLIFEVMPDDVFEGDETFEVTLSNLQNGSLSDGQASGTILDDDGTWTYRPDAQARKHAGDSWTGNDQYGPAGTQTLTVRLRPGDSREVSVRVQNDGTVADDWSFAEAGSGADGVRRRWSSGGADVTSEVASGNLVFHNVPQGASRKVTLTALARPGADPGTVATWHLHGVHNPLADGIRDVVTIRVRIVR